ncbi:MAG: histidinol phosphate aminotransferase [Pelagimonas sp.]|jgi:uncharacterized membrane protein
MTTKHAQRVEDFTNANLILIFVNLIWVFVAIWSAWGLGPVVILAAGLNHLITRLEFAKRRRAIGADNPPKV